LRVPTDAWNTRLIGPGAACLLWPGPRLEPERYTTRAEAAMLLEPAGPGLVGCAVSFPDECGWGSVAASARLAPARVMSRPAPACTRSAL